MSILDMRTRTKVDIRAIDASDFFLRELPSLIEANGTLAAPGAREFGVRPFSFITPSGAWTLSLSDETLAVALGDIGAGAIELGDQDFVYFIDDLTTLEMLYNVKRLQIRRGTQDDMHGWWAVLRSLVDARPLFTQGSIAMRDREGRELDVRRSFAPYDDDAEIGQFLSEAGYLHLAGWLDPKLMCDIAKDMDREFAVCTTSDGSWWATLEDGTRKPIRISNFGERSPALRRVFESDAFRRIARLTDDGFTHTGGGEALQKPLGVVSGISALPWHHDCALGAHSYKCCNLVIGISVTGAGPGSSQLGVLPGSHRALMPRNRLYPEAGLEPLFVATRTGDITVHCSCLTHMSQEPTEYERKVIYTNMELPIDKETREATDRFQALYHEVGRMSSEPQEESAAAELV